MRNRSLELILTFATMVFLAGAVRAAPLEFLDASSNRLDYLHDEISRRFLSSAERLDQFVGNRQADDESRASMLRLSMRTGYDWEGFHFSPAARVRLSLPRTEQKLHLFLDHINGGNSPLSEQDLPITMRDSQATTETGVRLFFNNAMRLSHYLDVGIDLPEDPFVRMTFSMTEQVEEWTFKPLAQLSWQLEEGCGIKLDMETKRVIQEHTLWLCAYSEVTDYGKIEGVNFIQNLSLPWRYTRKAVLTPRVELDCGTRVGGVIDVIWFTANYRRLIHSDWLFLELEPGLQSPEEKGYNIYPVIQFKLEGFFGSNKDTGPGSLFGGNQP